MWVNYSLRYVIINTVSGFAGGKDEQYSETEKKESDVTERAEPYSGN